VTTMAAAVAAARDAQLRARVPAASSLRPSMAELSRSPSSAASDWLRGRQCVVLPEASYRSGMYRATTAPYARQNAPIIVGT
jgi:hypothetical protein